ncbi:MAG: chemotaxis-specific protein-glutamate methyltransferase CheB [Chloroflexi bacterium]|nr:chemotaxis-specific protein-glutamate methyltransferase CheB [Chloroflexota bacterium]
MIRVLIVDDSAVLRQSTKFILESDPELKVVGEAANGADAVTQVARLKPDVITMDLHMPKMDGLEAIREIMAQYPAPIIVVTGVDFEREIGVSTQATRLGAVSVMRRPDSITSGDYKSFAAQLIRQVKAMSSVKVVRHARSLGVSSVLPMASNPGTPRLAAVESAPVKTQIVAIGSSTGGPAALHQVLRAMPKNFAVPILIVQHISFGFVDGLASWLNDACALHVQVGRAGERVEPGKVYIAPDDRHMIVDRFSRIGLSENPPVGGHRPAVTALFQSVAQAFGASALAVILTGMGADGAVGMKVLRDAGGITLAQDQASCVVFGMPKEAIALGAVRHIVPLDRIAQRIQELVVV